MDLEFSENMATEEEYLQTDADFDGSAFEGERCGICMDPVIDRGVLDCCQHWFCFACIDNWSTITNLCPLCQNEFQMITCVPVYDTIGGKRADEDSGSRDDEWSVEGKTSTLSFPSYYIDENAVTCLDDGCKIRSGSITFDESSSLDTSIACDSCDIWYHAFCVGFDPEGTSVELWLCPRCLTNETQRSALNLEEPVQFDSHSKNYEYEHHGANMFSGKVSVSVADDGETALVVSMVDQRQFLEAPSNDIASTSVFNNEHNFSLLVSGIVSPLSKHEEISKDQTETPESKMEAASDAVTKSSFSEQSPESKVKKEIISRPSSFEVSEDPLTDFHECSHGSELKVDTYNNATDHGYSIAGPLADNDNGILVDHLGKDSSVEKNNVRDEFSAQPCGKRKRKDHGETSESTKDQKKSKLQTDALPRKLRSDQASQRTSVTSEHESPVKISPLDIMSIVRDTEPSQVGTKQSDLIEGKKDMAGIRMKKIVRRPVEDKDSSSLVQKLRKEIREVVKNKKDVGQSIFDPKLLAAFRTAVAVPEPKSGKRVSTSIAKAKNMMFRKGKTRDNLTKKIFSTTSGKRRHDWHRDCQVEFWRRHCIDKTATPEKIETLKSVLNLLKTGPNPAMWEQNIEEEEGTNPILSRLYLADASVLPRNNNAKPLSTAEDSARPRESQVSSSADKEVKPPSDNQKTGNQDRNMASIRSAISSSDSTKKKSTPSSLRSGVASSSVGGESVATNSEKLKTIKSDEVTDKRKWALEILARKTATSSTSVGNQKKENNAASKEKYPLLAQLPGDMRPNLAPCRHKNIPISVRQAQLDRLAEHFLKLTNVSPMRKTGATELAIADAINVEKELANKSKSKVVYLNLVCQELRNLCNTTSANPVQDSNPSVAETNSSLDGADDTSGPAPPSSMDPEVEEALKNAGLLPDSPPSSPEKLNENDSLISTVAKWKEEGPDDILEMNPNAEIDIYGDFEYDLDDEDYMDANAVDLSNSKNEGEEESKVKVVFSTLSLDRPSPNSAVDTENAEKREHTKDDENAVSLLLPSHSTDEGGGGGGGQEPSIDECEELYGPNKEPKVVSDEAIAFGSTERAALLPQGDEREKVAPRRSSSDGNDPGAKSVGGKSQIDSQRSEKKKSTDDKEHSAARDSILKKVEAYIKEHIRPFCKSGIITVDQYRWAVTKTAEKVMKHHSKAKNATFLIKEGEKVKKLAEQYVEAATQKKDGK